MFGDNDVGEAAEHCMERMVALGRVSPNQDDDDSGSELEGTSYNG